MRSTRISLGDVLVDAATRFDARRILRRLRGRAVTLHASDACPPGPPGCEPCGVRGARNPALVWRSRRGRDGDTGRDHGADAAALALGHGRPALDGPPHPVSRRLREGDQVGTFTVIETPGHTAGHISFWREADRVLVAGDVLCNLNIWNGRVMLREPEAIFTLDPAQNRRSARRFMRWSRGWSASGMGPRCATLGRFARYIEKLPRVRDRRWQPGSSVQLGVATTRAPTRIRDRRRLCGTASSADGTWSQHGGSTVVIAARAGLALRAGSGMRCPGSSLCPRARSGFAWSCPGD